MAAQNLNSTRRAFLGNALKLGAGSLLLGSSASVNAAEKSISPAKSSRSLMVLPELPTHVLIEHEGKHLQVAERQGSRFSSDRAVVNLVSTSAGQEVRVTCPTGPLARVVLRWETTFPDDTLFLGDHWERGYGDLQWGFLQPERIMPWYFAAHQTASGSTFMTGVKTQPAALCF